MTTAPLKPAPKQTLLACTVLLVVLGIPVTFAFRSERNRREFLSHLPELASKKPSPPAVEVRTGALKKTLILDGELRAVRSRTVFGPATNQTKITYLPLEGSLIKPGDRLVEFDSGTVLSKIKETEEKIVGAENKITETKAQHEAAQRDLEVELSRLWLAFEQAKVQMKTYSEVPAEVVKRRDLQEKQLALEKAKTEYEAHLAKIEQKKKEQAAELQLAVIDAEKLKAQLNRTKNDLDQMNIKAVSEGMVIYTNHWNEKRKVQVGDVVSWGLPVVTVPDLTEMEILAQVSEVDGPKLSPGQKAKIILDSYPEQEISGVVKEVSQTAIKAVGTESTKMFKVVIALDKTFTEIMKPGMSAQISIVVAESGKQLVVPRSAVHFENSQAQVVRMEGGNTPRPVAVTILAADHEWYAVAGNGALKEGDQIVK